MQRLNLVQASVVGTLNHYRTMEQRTVDMKAQKQQSKRQPDKTLSARQERKQAKAWRRAQRESYAKLSPEFKEGLAILDEAASLPIAEGDRIQAQKTAA